MGVIKESEEAQTDESRKIPGFHKTYSPFGKYSHYGWLLARTTGDPGAG